MNPRILKFGAAWCGPCRALKPLLDKWAKEKGLEIEVVSLDKPGGLETSEKYNVQAVPTVLFVDDKGKELASVMGYGAETMALLDEALRTAQMRLVRRESRNIRRENVKRVAKAKATKEPKS
jgi:thiol-disulfide isomerase/thioredoxin